MAWSLRQPIVGDRFITVANVDDNVSNCYVDGNGYIPDSISFEIDNVAYLIPAAVSFSYGFFNFQLPSNLVLKAGSTVRVYSNCDSNSSELLNVRAVNFKVTSSVITACNPSTTLVASYEDIIRMFFGNTEGQAFNLKLNGANLDISAFEYQPGTIGSISSNAGIYSVPAGGTAAAYLYSKTTYPVPTVLTITPLVDSNYYTVRLGYIEVIFSNTDILYNNYLSGQNDIQIASNIGVGSTFSIESNSSAYVIKINGVSQVSIPKDISFTVSGGSVSPSSGNINTNVIWTLPTSAGSYDIVVTMGSNLKFVSTVNLHSCAKANNDTFTGVYGSPVSGNLLTNDVKCLGENTYVEEVHPNIVVGLVVNQDGTFTYTPSGDYVGVTSFSYKLRCGSTFETSEVIGTANVTITYPDPCTGVVASWENTGVFRCNNCVEEKEQRDLNSACTGNTNVWVVNPTGTQCNKAPVYTPIDEYQCLNCVDKRVVIDTNPCSPTYNSRGLINYPDGNLCNTDPDWEDTGETECIEGVHKRKQINSNLCSNLADRWIPTGQNICFCNAQVTFRYICDTDVTVAGVEVHKYGESSNRLISYANNIVTFTADIGKFDYIVFITNSLGMTSKIKVLNYTCQPS